MRAEARLDCFTAERPLVIVTDFPPDARGGGAVIVRSLLADDDLDRLVWVTLSRFDGDDAGFPPVISLAERRRDPSLIRNATIRRRELVRRVREIMRERNAAAAWVIAHGASVCVAAELAEADIPTHVTVHDDPAWAYALLTRRYLLLAPLFARDCARALRSARSVDVVSEAMANRYRSRHGRDPTVIHRGLAGRVTASEAYERKDGLSVAVLGSTYGERELRSLATALGLVEEHHNIPTRLTVIGTASARRLRQVVPGNVRLAALGHLAETDGVAQLRNSFVLYLGYPFGWRGRVLRTTSFPTKLSTYVMAARPLLVHAPADSSVACLAETAPYATPWTTLDPQDGVSVLLELWRDPRAAESFHVDAELIRTRHFDFQRNRTRLIEVLNLLPRSPAPPPL
jgi:hypothetical protein